MAIGYKADNTGTETLMMRLRPAFDTTKLNTVNATCHVRYPTFRPATVGNFV